MIPTEFLFHSGTFFWCAFFIEDNRNITALFLYINLLRFLDRCGFLPGIIETKLKLLLGEVAGFKPSHQKSTVRFVLFMQYPNVTPIRTLQGTEII